MPLLFDDTGPDGYEYDIEDLLYQFEEHRREHGHPCTYVEFGCRDPDWSVMTPPQRDYYLYWRDMLSAGKCLKADRGYVRLRIMEIINSDMDPQKGMDELRILLQNVNSFKGSSFEIGTTMFDYAVANDLELPRIRAWISSSRSSMIASEVMSHPVSRIGRDLMRGLSGNPDVYCGWTDGEAHVKLFNDSLEAIDRHLFETTGRGVAETFGNGKVTDQYEVYGNLPYRGERTYMISYLRLDNDFTNFMRGLYTYSLKLICKDNGEKGPSTPSSFGKDLRRIVERVHDNGPDDVPHIPKEWPGTDRVPLSAKERALMEMGETLCQGDDHPNGVMIVDPKADERRNSPHMRSDIECHWTMDVEDHVPYTASGYTNPDYRSMDDDQRAFYLRWRTLARRGTYVTTDSGYVWLLMSEIIHMEHDARKGMEALMGLYDAYGEYDKKGIIGKVCFEYEMYNNLPVRRPSKYESNVSANCAMFQFLSGKGSELDADLVLFMSNLGDSMPRNTFDSDCLGITLAMLSEIEGRWERNGGSITEYCYVPRTTIRAKLFSDIRFFGDDGTTGIAFPNYVYSPAFTRELAALVKAVIKAVSVARKGKEIKIAKLVLFGIGCGTTLTRLVNTWFSEKTVKETKERAMSLTLDRGAVSDAESALNDVTEMMMVDEGPHMIDEPVRDVTTGPSGGWDGLDKALDDVQKGYLKACLEGRGKPYLKEHGTTVSRMEDSINGISMEVVGDPVVEDGHIIEDYVGEIRSILLM